MKNFKLTNTALVIGFVFCGSVYAEQKNESNDVVVKGNLIQPAHVAYFDSKTGKLTSKRPEGVAPLQLSQEELRSMSKSNVGLKLETMPNGAVKIDKQDRFQHFSMMTVDKDGKQKRHCVNGDGISHDHVAQQGDK